MYTPVLQTDMACRSFENQSKIKNVEAISKKGHIIFWSLLVFGKPFFSEM